MATSALQDHTNPTYALTVTTAQLEQKIISINPARMAPIPSPKVLVQLHNA